MAPLPVIADTYRCALNWTNSDTGLTAANVIHIRKTSSNPAAIATILDGAVAANMWAMQTSHSHISSVLVTPLDGGSITYPFSTGSPAKWSGVVTSSQEFTPATCNIIKLLTSKRGRSYRGRIFLPWVAEAAVADGQLGTGATTVTTAWVAFKAAIVAASATLVVASYKIPEANDVAALACELEVATQRRRWTRSSATP